MAKAIMLLSGGIDSPVAAHMLTAQGVSLTPLHMSFEPVTDAESTAKAAALANHLDLGPPHVAKVGEALAAIARDRDAHRFYFVLQKRMFYRLADRLAKQEGADWIATGENLGQVSSQTLHNLTTLEAAAERPVLRPLLGLDKNDIIRVAKEAGTYELSLGPELCDMLGPTKPATVSRHVAIAEMEERLGLLAATDDIAIEW